MKQYVILHNIRSAHNVGSIFRTAEGAGVAKIFLTGYTPAPIDRFGRVRAEIEKTSLGASQMVPHESSEDIMIVLEQLARDGVHLVAIEQTPQAINYNSFHESGDVAYIFGNEITGIETEILEKVPTHVEIPLKGEKESLNVSVCVGIILFSNRVQ